MIAVGDPEGQGVVGLEQARSTGISTIRLPLSQLTALSNDVRAADTDDGLALGGMFEHTADPGAAWRRQLLASIFRPISTALPGITMSRMESPKNW